MTLSHCFTSTLLNPGMAEAWPSDAVKKRSSNLLPSVNYPVLIISDTKMWDYPCHSIPSLYLSRPFSVFFPFVAAVNVYVHGISFV